MRSLAFAAVTVVSCLTACSTFELKHREAKIAMVNSSVNTNTAPASGVAKAGESNIKTPFREYDEKVIRTIQKRWYKLLDATSLNVRGEVIVNFKLNPDGHVTDVQERPTKLNVIAVVICKRAILDAAPFEPFPADMRGALGGKAREVTFRFYYE